MPTKHIADDFADIAQRLNQIEGPKAARLEPTCVACFGKGWRRYGAIGMEWRQCDVCWNQKCLPPP